MLDPSLYPRRTFVRAGECGLQPLRDLEAWVKGGAFHRYGVKAYDRGPTLEEALERMREIPGILKIDGELLDYRSRIEYWITYRQTGDTDSYGFGGAYFTPEDAAYSALSYIEERERKVYEENLVVGLA
jgi:hypothetical protein